VLVAFDGLAPPSELESRDERIRGLDGEVDEEQKMRKAAETKLEELLQAAEDNPEALTSKLAIAKSNEEGLLEQIARLEGKVKHAEECGEIWKQESGKARVERDQMRARMACWLEDRTAAESSDYYRVKYDQAIRHEEQVQRAILTGCNDARKAATSKTRRDAVYATEAAIDAALKRERAT
jgi:hypothetical protein